MHHQLNPQLTPRRAPPRRQARQGLGAATYEVVYFYNSSGQWQQVYAGDPSTAEAVGAEYLAAGNQNVIGYVYDDSTRAWRIWDFVQNGYTQNNAVAAVLPPTPSGPGGSSSTRWPFVLATVGALAAAGFSGWVLYKKAA